MAEAKAAKDDEVRPNIRQFSCFNCVHRRPFWGRPPRGQCNECKEWLLPVDREEEIGHGKFTCPTCGNEFANGKAKWSVAQPCYGEGGTQVTRTCQEEVFAGSIGPPPRSSVRRSKEKQHRCNGCETGECQSRPQSEPAE